ncbi:MAG: serine dehydratase subunit alpha family protein [Acidobacteria bacterium]|nr:serine dehydratase subunit alpha family protein [Acidobacteriota bacterium]MBI3488170.1 serine dehydratase subunit alpha family protein [Acidobacteriota bacterium]
MRFSDYLAAEWKPALGCTEPAAVAWATALAAGTVDGAIQRVCLTCDPRIYKNCYAVGLPNSEGKTGILWTLAIGASLNDSSKGLRSFEATTPSVLAIASDLMMRKAIRVEVDARRSELYIDVTVESENGTGRAVIEREHTHLTALTRNGEDLSVPPPANGDGTAPIRANLAGMSIRKMMDVALSLSPDDRKALREGIRINTDMAVAGMDLVPARVMHRQLRHGPGRAEMYVNAGVMARMSGVARTVMTLAGSGNKGLTVSIPVWLWGRELGLPDERIDEALAMACLVTSATTHHLGTLSAACGSAIAAGAGVAAGLVMLEGGGADEADLAVSSVVGTLAGMICDGAKVGCAMKTVTGVEAAFRASEYAMSGQGLPPTNGITGIDGKTSLVHLGLIISRGMAGVDTEILDIMQIKLKPLLNHQR